MAQVVNDNTRQEQVSGVLSYCVNVIKIQCSQWSCTQSVWFFFTKISLSVMPSKPFAQEFDTAISVVLKTWLKKEYTSV